MFAALSQRLAEVLKRLAGRGRLSPQDVEQALKEVRMALLEADVHFRVVKEFTERVRQRAVGQEVLESLSPAHQVVKIVRDELTQLLGGTHVGFTVEPPWPAVVALVGLQGSGKTTTAAKLARHLRARGRRVLLVGCDLRRPAAVDQLATLARQAGVEFFGPQGARDGVEVARRAVAHARQNGYEVVVLDTAGRLHVDEELMEELERLAREVTPARTLLVVDAMMGQDAVQSAQAFASRIHLDGLVLTKLDGDSRGGAALSVRAVTGAPVVFAGTGEKLDQLEPFYPDRMAARILGMGDVLSLIERAEQAVDRERAQQLVQHLREDRFGLDDYLGQLRQLRRMGPLEQVLSMIPGLRGRLAARPEVDEKELVRMEAIILSMTPEERRNPSIIDASRRRRIARGSGTQVQDVNRLLRQFDELQRLMRRMVKSAKGKEAGLPWR
ncbi:MAG TPA: signal recognition particle protein [Limnochordales bacterium]